MMTVATGTRLADVLGALSAATDLAAGVPLDTALRLCVLTTALGKAYGVEPAALADLYFAGLLRHLGCTSISHEIAVIGGGDDLTAQAGIDGADLNQFEPAQRQRAGVLFGLVCDQAASLACDLGMSPGVQRVLAQLHERFDGGGIVGLRGEDIEPNARILHVAMLLEVSHRRAGRRRSLEEVERQRGRQLDPALCDLVTRVAASLWPLLEATSLWDAYLDAEPGSPCIVAGPQLDAVALGFARYADLKAPCFLGHSTAVSALAVAAGEHEGLSGDALTGVRRAGLLHDLGLASVPNGILEKRGPLTPAEWDRVHLHAYYTDRILARVPALALAAQAARAHHERCDGSGYPRGVAPSVGERGARLLAAADMYCALIEARPHRPASTPTRAAELLALEAREQRLCPKAVDSVSAAAGVKSAPRDPEKASPDGLTAREIEVLAHVARGLTSKEVASLLSISTRTAQHHLEHIYEKIGVTTRAAAALYAVRHELLRPD
jgi:HD-GYP domain-containing protein (c-di-GMP phosphodiesterase class II)